mmetsp:Transcript_20892/g.31000  ORF Transcript_20892/g.31000 Transcript_20892/m.31000 type:complete len:402 (+) Transcript_20892:13-1218(+)
MKIYSKKIEKNGNGYVFMEAEESEDMWHAYNLISIGDYVRTSTLRKVVNESSTGSTTSKRVRLKLKISVEKTDFDTESCVLRLSGRNIEESPHVKKGAYHTLDLELHNKFSIEKSLWDSIHFQRLSEASDPLKKADISAVVLSAGLAHVCLVTNHLTLTRARIEINIPRKRAGNSGHSKAMKKFYEAVYRAVLEKIDFSIVKCVLLGSPGFFKDDFFEFLNAESVRRDDRIIIENKGKFVLCGCSSGHKNAVEEMMSQPSIMNRLAETKAAEEINVLQDFLKMMRNDQDRAFYGFNHVKKALRNDAIDSLLVTDSLFRSSDLVTRKKYVLLVENCKKKGGKVYVFSRMHISGEQLENLSGIAAILRFPIPDVESEEESEDKSASAEASVISEKVAELKINS